MRQGACVRRKPNIVIVAQAWGGERVCTPSLSAAHQRVTLHAKSSAKIRFAGGGRGRCVPACETSSKVGQLGADFDRKVPCGGAPQVRAGVSMCETGETNIWMTTYTD
jgi:hypothetical protein